jgi:hypothetical protein
MDTMARRLSRTEAYRNSVNYRMAPLGQERRVRPARWQSTEMRSSSRDAPGIAKEPDTFFQNEEA